MMKKVPRQPTIPPSAQETTRHAIVTLLVQGVFSAKEISKALGLAEKGVYGHLEHIRRSIQVTGGALQVIPAECRSCGFLFSKRERLTPPGKCPVCRKEAIQDPLFRLRGLDNSD
jgi:transcriptional regulator